MLRWMMALIGCACLATGAFVFGWAGVASAGPGSGAVIERDCVAGGGSNKDGVCFGGRWDGAPIYT